MSTEPVLTQGEPPVAAVSRRGFFKRGALGAGVLAVGALGYRVAALPDGAPAQAGGVLTRQELAALTVLSVALFPPNTAFGPDGQEAGVAGYVDRYIAQLRPIDQKIVRALIWVYDQGTVLGGSLRSVRFMAPEQARAYVLGWESSRFTWRRDLAMSLRTVLGMGYFAHPQVRAAIGIDEPCVTQGPSLLRLGRPA